MPGIEPFEPSASIQGVSYSVFQVRTLESRTVTQAQAFSGRDEEVEDWAARSAAVPRVMRPLPHSLRPPPATILGVRGPLATYPSDGITVEGPYHTNLPWTPPPFDRGSVMEYYPPQRTPFSTGDHFQLSPPSTSSPYEYASTPATVAAVGHSNYQDVVNFPLASPFTYPTGALPHCYMGTASPYAPQQAPSGNVDMDYFALDAAMVHQSYQEEAPYSNAFDPSAVSSFPGAGSQTAYCSEDIWFP